jgi:hypothetical protein
MNYKIFLSAIYAFNLSLCAQSIDNASTKAPAKVDNVWTCKGWVEKIVNSKIMPSPDQQPLALTDYYIRNVQIIAEIPEIAEQLKFANNADEDHLIQHCRNIIQQDKNDYVDKAIIDIAKKLTEEKIKEINQKNKEQYKVLKSAKNISAVFSGDQ